MPIDRIHCCFKCRSSGSPVRRGRRSRRIGLHGAGELSHRTDRIAAAGVIALAVVGTMSCSSSDSPPATNSGGGTPATGTPAGTSNVTVTGTSGSSSTGVPVTLTVTR